MVKYVGIFYMVLEKDLYSLPLEVAYQHVRLQKDCPVFVRVERFPIDTATGELADDALEVALDAAHPYPGENVMNTHFIE